MNLLHIKAIILQDAYTFRRNILTRSDIFFFSFLNVVILGGISLYLSGGASSEKGRLLLVGMVLWEIVRACQYFIGAWTLWNLYSNNLSNMFIAPLSVPEFVVGNFIAAAYKTILLMIPLTAITKIVFDFDLTSVGYLVIFISTVDLLLFALAFGLIIVGFIFRFGIRVQALCWTAVFVFQPLMGVYFPVDLLPAPLQVIAHAIPATYVFEGIQDSIQGAGSGLRLVLIGLILNLLMLLVSIKLFTVLLNKARVAGQFGRP